MADVPNHAAAQALAQDWIEAWNTLDLQRLMLHYAPDIVMTSPRIAQAFRASGGTVGSEDGTLRGITEVTAYFAAGMQGVPGLRMGLLHCTMGLGPSVGIVYRRENGTVAVEVLRLQPDGRAVQAEVLYGAGAL